ncbi:hypothetical protein, partial [Thermus islandicus]|uniref:hypothetical protein n=1 Tax=Thermus islandicus TaxID=540988 RepID=UPI001B7FB33A
SEDLGNPYRKTWGVCPLPYRKTWGVGIGRLGEKGRLVSEDLGSFGPGKPVLIANQVWPVVDHIVKSS